MTTELEQKFYDTFGIEPRKLFSARMGINPDAVIYPIITAEKLLELICLINKNTKNYNKSTYFKQDYKNLKDEILEETLFCYKTNCLFDKEKQKFKHQIQQLFKD